MVIAVKQKSIACYKMRKIHEQYTVMQNGVRY